MSKATAFCLCLVCTLIVEAKPFVSSREVPETFWGTTNHHHYDWNVGAMKDLGLTCSRVDFLHEALESSEGVYSFGDASHWIIKSTERGLKEKFDLLAVVTTYGTYDRIEANPAAFEKFAFEIAAKYRGKIRYWEASNEPDMFVKGKKYVTMLKAFYKGIKKADPNNKVVLAGMAGDEAANFEMVYKLGGKNYFDIVNSHSYTRPRSPEEGGYIQRIKNLYLIMKKYGDDKPCWVTEMGWNGVEPSLLEYLWSKSEGFRSYMCSEEDQARYTARTYLLSASIPWIERVYFFHLAVDPPYSQVGTAYDDYINIYQVYGNGQVAPKLGYYALKTVVGMINRSTFQEQLNLGKRLWGLVFTRNGEGIIVLWGLDEQVVLPLQDVSMIKSITSMVGTPIPIGKDITISGRPIYLKTDVKNLDAMKKQILSARPKGTRTYSISLGLDVQQSTANEPVLMLSVMNNSPMQQEAPTANIQVQSPWRLKNPLRKDAAPLAVDEMRNYALPVTGPSTNRGGEVVLEAKAWLTGIRPSVSTANHVRYASFLPSPNRCEPLSLGSTPEQREMSDWKGPGDCSATWYCMYDRDNLYFHAEVTDDVHFQPNRDPNGSQIWEADSIQIAIDPEADAKPCSNVPQYDGVNDVEFGLALAKDRPVFYVWTNPIGQTGPLPLKDLTITRDEQAKLTRYQAAIPWSLLGWKKDPTGKWMGFNVVVNDDDGAGRKGYLQWSPGIAQTKDPSRYHKVFFSPR